MSSRIEDLTPQTGFLGDYIAHAREQIMAPLEFHLATGLALVSAAIGRGARFKLGGWRYPSIWQVVLAPAGAGKSSAISPLHDLIEKVRGSDAILPSRFSPEAWYESAEKTPDGVWSVGEIGALLGNMRKDYMAGFAEELCDVFDHKTTRRKTRRDDYRVEHPAITLITTGRSSDFTDQAGLEAFTSGLMSRFLVYTTSEPPVYRGLRDQDRHEAVPEIETALRSYLDDLNRLRSLPKPVPVELTEGAIDRWEADDRRWHDELARGEVPRILEGFAKRRGIQALKLAVLHALSRSQTPVVLDEDAAWGCMVAAFSYSQVEALTSGGQIGLDRAERRRSEIYARAKAMAVNGHRGIVRKRDLLRAFSHALPNMRALDDQIAVWAGGELVQEGWLKPATGRPAAAIRILELGLEPPPEWEPKP